MKAKKKSKSNVFMLITLFVIVFGSIILTGFLSNATSITKTEDPKYKYYTSIQLEEGDSLWVISEKYITAEYNNIDDYIAEVKSINSLTNDNITAGSYLTVPYYSTELK